MRVLDRLRGHRSPSPAEDLRRRCEDRLAALDVPEPFDLDLFVERLAEARGRPLTQIPYPMGGHGSPCGMWVALADADVIFVDAATTGTQRDNIVGHELGHIVADHASDTTLAQSLGQVTLPGLSLLDPAMVQRVLGRTSYSTREEQEAEVFAWLLLGRRSWPATTTTFSSSSSSQTVARARQLLE